jgi:hypothetical protein
MNSRKSKIISLFKSANNNNLLTQEQMIESIVGSDVGYNYNNRDFILVYLIENSAYNKFYKFKTPPRKIMFYRSSGTGGVSAAGTWMPTGGVALYKPFYRSQQASIDHVIKITQKVLTGEYKDTSDFIKQNERKILSKISFSSLTNDSIFDGVEYSLEQMPYDAIPKENQDANNKIFSDIATLNSWAINAGGLVSRVDLPEDKTFIPGLHPIVKFCRDQKIGPLFSFCPKFCGECGEKVTPNSSFCGECGTKIYSF